MEHDSIRSDEHVMQVQSDVTVKNASVFKDSLLNALNEHERLCLDLSSVEELDMAFFQLLCAAHKSARESGKVLTIDPQGISEPVHEAASLSGFKRHVGCFPHDADTCLWLEED